jgi:hypothetical protein
MRMAVEYGRSIGFKGDFYIEPKPKEPMKHQYDFDAATAIGFLKQYGLDKDFKINIEANHATLAGHTFQHELRISAMNGMLGSIDANQGDYLLGWDTDEFPFNVYDTTACMYEVLKAGGMKHGGFVETVYYSDGDPFFSACAEYKLTLTLPKEYVVAATGEIVEERTLESKKVYTMSAMNVRDFALALSEDFRELSVNCNGKTLYYYYYNDKSAAKTLESIRECFSFYEKTFGEYPYSQYSVAQTGLCFSGMEYPCLSLVSDSLSEEEQVRVIAHETAHQWWYGVVGSDQLEEAWQDEGLAEYSALAFFEEYEKYGVQRDEVVREAMREYRSYYDVYGSVLGRTDTAMTRNLASYLSDYEYRCLAYDKAIIMLDTLRKSVGEQKFFSALERYYKDYRFQMATADDFIGCFEKSGLDVRGFFDSFLLGKAIL